MTSRERVYAALSGAAVDRPPVSFWGHFYHRESTAEDLVAATLEAWRAFEWDWVKLNPRKHYHVEPWGVRYTYSEIPGEKPRLSEWPIHEGADWARVTARPKDEGALGEQITAVRMLRRELPPEVPLIETVFTPLAVLGEMTETPGELRLHMTTHPELVRRALEAVTVTFERTIAELLRAGADGIYFATVDWASRDLMSADDYRTWARPFDLRAFAAAAGAPFNVLHVCGSRNLLLDLVDYPVHAFSWAATDPSNPSLAQALTKVRGAVMGGISQADSLLQRLPDQALAEYHTALEQTAGRRWMVAPGCSIPPTALEQNLRAVRDAVRATQLSGEPMR
jgi:uroporphyrinogen decarboxylase